MNSFTWAMSVGACCLSLKGKLPFTRNTKNFLWNSLQNCFFTFVIQPCLEHMGRDQGWWSRVGLWCHTCKKPQEAPAGRGGGRTEVFMFRLLTKVDNGTLGSSLTLVAVTLFTNRGAYSFCPRTVMWGSQHYLSTPVAFHSVLAARSVCVSKRFFTYLEGVLTWTVNHCL